MVALFELQILHTCRAGCVPILAHTVAIWQAWKWCGLDAGLIVVPVYNDQLCSVGLHETNELVVKQVRHAQVRDGNATAVVYSATAGELSLGRARWVEQASCSSKLCQAIL